MNRSAFSDLLFNAPVEPLTAISSAYMLSYYGPSYFSFAEYENARSSVERFASQQHNWDGYGALPITDETKKNAMAALSGLQSAPVPGVMPNPNGTLSFEWETDAGIGHLEIGRTRYSFYIRPNVGPAILMDGSAENVFGIGALVSACLYSKPSEPAYTRLQTAENV